MRAAAEAMIEAFIIIDAKAWGLFVVKRAAALEFAACLGDFEAAANEGREQRAGSEFVKKGWGQ